MNERRPDLVLDIEQAEIPAEIPLLPVRNFVIYPFMIAPLIISDALAIAMIDQAIQGRRIIGLFAEREDEEGSDPDRIPLNGTPPSLEERLYDVGCAAMVLRMLKIPDGTLRLLLHGMRRIRRTGPITVNPYPTAPIETIAEVCPSDNETEALKKTARALLEKIVEVSSSLPGDLLVAANNSEDPGRLADMITSNLSLNLKEQQEILSLADCKQRLLRVQQLMNRELEIMRIGSKIQTQVKTNLDRVQKDYFLREQLKAIRRELGDDEDSSNELDELYEKIKAAALPEHAATVANKELGRLRTMSPSSAEYTVARSYLDWILALPWSRSTEDNIDLAEARRILDEDHYDLEKVKDRILEFLAVIKLRQRVKGSILCLVGPPGVGKTSLGRSIARAMGRKFVRISLGGVRDEAEIRGHRRTYIGSMPGRLIKGLKDADSNNPLILLDEVDKLGADFRGDPSSALLEVLDPEQNHTFTDHYLDMPFDLSRVMFLTTANSMESIPGPLLDRMELIRLSGYTLMEKMQIARKYLIPRAVENTGLTPSHVDFRDDALQAIIEHYTREAGLRNLEREIMNICRKLARKAAEGKRGRVVVNRKHVLEALGPVRFDMDLLDGRTREAGVVIGLAWTPVGGDILFIEATATAGKGKLVLTGQLGDVMKESVQAALTWLHANAPRVGIAEELFSERDLHVHVPAGAIPKDGPSAGIAMLTAMASLMKGQAVRDRLAMTGEITLKGAVLPIGGVKEKVLAAHRSGIRTLILPKRNEKDLIDIPEEIRSELTVHFVQKADEVLKLALEPAEEESRGAAAEKKGPAIKRKLMVPRKTLAKKKLKKRT